MRTLTCKHKIWGKNWLYLRAYLKAFSVFNVIETCRVYLLATDLAIVKFMKKIIERFLKNAQIVGMDQITCKNCNRSSWMQVNEILLTRDRPEQFPSFVVCNFQWNQTTMRWSRVSKAYQFLKNLANCLDSMRFHCFYDAWNFVSKYLENTLIEFVQTLTKLRQLWQVQTPLSDFLNKLPVQRNTMINKKRNGIVTLPWRLR